MKKPFLFSLCLILVACAKGTDKDTRQAENTIQQSTNASKKLACDGVGNSFNGVYVINSEVGKAKCTDNPDVIDTLGVAFVLKCKQNDGDFKCQTDIKKESIDGCINKDGNFSISIKSDLGSFEKLMSSSGVQNLDMLTLIEGKIEKDDGQGKIKYSSVASAGKQKKGCNLSWDITLEKKSDE